MEDFRQARLRNGLTDLGWSNLKYSWSNRHKEKTYTKERLDRVVANKRWLTDFSSPGVETILTSRSDHLPSVLSTEDKRARKVREIIRFEAKWALEEDREGTIQHAWQHKFFSSNCWPNIQSKLSFCSKELMKWSATKKKLSKQELAEKIALLKALQNQTVPDMHAIKTLEKVIDNWLEREDVKWKQRAKKEWYKGGDKNTKFFHARATQRRKNNKILMIKNHHGAEVST